jgi:CIC family chloride channel protein
LRNLCLQKSNLFFLSSVLVGISSAFAVIVLKSFAHQVFSFTYINGILKLSFINSLLPIAGLVLTVFVVKRVLGGSIDKGTSQILYSVAKKASIVPKKMYAQIITSSLLLDLRICRFRESHCCGWCRFGSNYAQRYKLSYKDRTLLIGCGVAAGIAAAFNALLQVFYLLSNFTCRCQYSGIYPIMIAAATGAWSLRLSWMKLFY